VNRATLIKLVHAGARHAFNDEDARKQWQESRTGQRSCKDMSDAQLENLVAELRRKKALKPLQRKAPTAKKTPADKIRALWIDMHTSGLINDGTEKALGKYLHRMTGRYKAEWIPLPDAMRVIESLKKWRIRLEEQKG